MRLLPALLAVATGLYGQKPVIFPGGVVNAASYATGGLTGKAVALGSIVSIFGRNLAAAAQSASGVALPTTLGGTSVTVNGIPAPIFYVSPGQVNIQLPSRYPVPFFGLEFVVTTRGGASDPVSLPEVQNVFGIFTLDGSGCGPGAVLNVASDGSVSLNSLANSASPGDFIEVYGTGLGTTFNQPPDGSPASSNPLALALNWGVYGAIFDLAPPAPSTPLRTRVSWGGRAPGLVGVDQVNIQVPEIVREGCGVPLTVAGPGGRSQPVPISIRRGGGACVDPPIAGYGQITWERTVASGITPSGETDVITAAFPASPGKQAPLPEQRCLSNIIDFFGPSCPLPGYKNLDAGKVMAQGPDFGPVQAVPAVVDGQTVYRAALSSGTIRPGSFSVTASGGSEVGPFQSSVRIGSGINITSSFPPGTILRPAPATGIRLVVVNWTGGDPDTWVTLKVVAHRGYADQYSTICQARAAEGTITGVAFGSGPPGRVEIIIEVTPDPAQIPALSAPGLSLGGQHLWKYTYRFGGLTIQ